MEVTERIAGARDVLTKSERRVAEVILQRPEIVAFGTVAELGGQARAGAATVVRFAVKLGYDGFTGLQASIRSELEGRLRPAVERIRRPLLQDLLAVALDRELGNVHETLEAVDRQVFAAACGLLADLDRRVLIISGEATRGVAIQAGSMLDSLRPGVAVLDGNPVAVTARLAAVTVREVVLAIDLRRYEAWVVGAARSAVARGAALVSLTDSRLSPLAEADASCFFLAAEGSGPFDSHVGTLALLNAFVAGVAERLQPAAAGRLDAIEAAWHDAGVLLDS